jgi:peptidyl-dipeptidase A
MPLLAQEPNPVTEARQFIASHEALVRPLEIAQGLAEWEADVSGSETAFAAKEKAQNRLDEALSDPARFATAKRLRLGLQGNTRQEDKAIRRQIELLYLSYLGKQLDPGLLRQIAAKEAAIGKTFNTYRAKVNGKELADSEVRQLLRASTDSAQRKVVWEASKGVGALVESDLKKLVDLRNEAARKLGFKNFHALSLTLNEQEPAQVLRLFDELDALVRAPFKEAKAAIDAQLAKQCRIAVSDLRPWHYQDPFFQEAPAHDTVALGAIYAKADILKLCREFYAGIGLPIDKVLEHSDLYEKPGKYPHARCADIDRAGDVRVMANIVPDEYWMGTMLHELGHSVYASPYIPADVPYVLRGPAHSLTTEGIAMMFEKDALDTTWLQGMGLSVPNLERVTADASQARRNHLLIFAAWSQVMFRFEKAMYENPNQDLNRLWWDLVEKYQMIHRPEKRNAPDYAAKIHMAQTPAYYHNYLMGQLFAAQVHHTLAREVLHQEPRRASYIGHKEVGEYLKTRVFAPGAVLSWNELTKFATGEELNPKAFAEDLKQ